jgi:hypothetical protein
MKLTKWWGRYRFIPFSCPAREPGIHECTGTPWYTYSASEGKSTHPLLGCPKRCIQARDLDVNFHSLY